MSLFLIRGRVIFQVMVLLCYGINTNFEPILLSGEFGTGPLVSVVTQCHYGSDAMPIGVDPGNMTIANQSLRIPNHSKFGVGLHDVFPECYRGVLGD